MVYKTYRTTTMNVIAHRIFQLKKELPQNKNRKNDLLNHFSCLVADDGYISKHFVEHLERIANMYKDEYPFL